MREKDIMKKEYNKISYKNGGEGWQIIRKKEVYTHKKKGIKLW